MLKFTFNLNTEVFKLHLKIHYIIRIIFIIYKIYIYNMLYIVYNIIYYM